MNSGGINMSERCKFKVKLTPREAEIIQRAVSIVHDENTELLRGIDDGWGRPAGEERAELLEESAALRRVRNALRRQFGRIG